MRPFTRFAHLKNSTTGNYFTAMTQKGFQHFLKIKQLRLTVYQRHHINAEHALHLCLLVEVIQHHFAGFAALQLNHHAHTILIGFIAQFGNTFKPFLFNQFSNFFQQARLVHLIRQFGNNNGFTASTLIHFYISACSHINTAFAGAVGLPNTACTIDDTGGREIWPRQIFHQVIDIHIRVSQQRQTRIHGFCQVMRGNIGGHTDRNPGGTVDQQIGNTGRKDRRFAFIAVIVRNEIDRFLVDIHLQFMR